MSRTYKVRIQGKPPFGWYFEEEIEAATFRELADKALQLADKNDGEVVSVQILK